ncbi:autotransporter-associated beta strand repeat-containing protein, partial [Campylobacter coli]
AGSELDISLGGNQTIGALSGVAGSSLALGSSTLTFGDSTNQTFAGVIGGTGGLIKQGSGVQTLTGANTFSGGLNLAAGGLVLG